MLTDNLKLKLAPEKGLNIILTVGNTLRRDDGLGPYIYKGLNYINNLNKNIEIINVGINPENYIDNIIDKMPDKIIIIDAASFYGKAGEIRAFDIEDIPGSSLSTHNIPLSLIAALIKSEMEVEIIFLGIQIQDIGFGEGLNGEIKSSSDELINYFRTVYQ